MNKIKVLRIIARLNIGGPAIHTILLTQGLDKDRFETILACGNPGCDEGNMSYYAQEKGVTPYIVPELKRKLSFADDIRAFFKLYKLIAKEKPHIIHTHTAKAGTLGRSAGILYNFLHPLHKHKIVLIHTFHGHVLVGYFSKFKSQIFLYLERILSLFSNSIITVSKTLKEKLLVLGIAKEDKIKVIPLGFELDNLLGVPLRQEEGFTIGIVGRLVLVKNHLLFLEAAQLLLREYKRQTLKFKIIGDGELNNQLKDYVTEHNLSGQIEFLGWQKDLYKIYSGLDLVALTSINEGTPVSLIEALACGRAVVTTDVGGIRDLLGVEDKTNKNRAFQVMERGIMVESGDAKGFSAALSFIIEEDALRKRMGRLGREFIRDNYTKDRLIKDIEGLYSRSI